MFHVNLSRYRKENIRRRHNYTPFIVQLMKILARESRLNSLTEDGYRAARERSAKMATEKTMLELKRKQ